MVVVQPALVNKGVALDKLGNFNVAESVFSDAIAFDPNAFAPRIGLGNMLLDSMGDPVRALAAYEGGLAVVTDSDDRALLHANCAYALALHDGDTAIAHEHARQALANGNSISAAGRHLLGALLCLSDPPAARWPRVFEQIGKAVDSGDSSLWSNYLDDLQRLLWFIVARGEGDALRQWMNGAQYPMRYAPLYHALVAAIDGEDHLLRINPETRHPAARIYDGIAHRLRIYGKDRLK